MSVSYGTRYRWQCMERERQARNTPEAVETTRLMGEASKLANADVALMFPGGINAENAGDVLQYLRERDEFHQRQLGVRD